MDLDKIIYSIRDALGVNSDDRTIDVPNKLIIFEYENARATYLEQLYSKGGRYDDVDLNQSIVLPMVQADRSACPAVPVNCTILRSAEKMPSDLLYTHRGFVVSHLGPLDILNKSFNLIPYSRVSTIDNRHRIISNSINAFILNGYIYVYGMNNPVLALLEKLNIIGIFSNPYDIIRSGLCNQDCNKYPMKPQYHTYVFEIVLKRLALQSPKDEINDSSGTLYQTAPQTKQRSE